jgi:transcription initiation factor TFIIIB Brf1 subunit/transcription initiation factor TFIIB
MEINIFDDINMLEPKCPKCLSKVEYGVTTEFDEKRKKHICRKCGHVFK